MRKECEYAGKIVKIKATGEDYMVEDWCENVLGRSWMAADGNPAAMQYAIRAGVNNLPIDNDVLYGKVGCLGALYHISEIEVPE